MIGHPGASPAHLRGSSHLGAFPHRSVFSSFPLTSTATMILLEYGNLVLKTILKEHFANHDPAKPSSLSHNFADFDGVQFNLATENTDRNVVYLSISWRCFSELASYNAVSHLEKIYGPLVSSPRPGYDFTLAFNMSQLPASETERDELIENLSLLKRHALAVPFERAFDAQLKGDTLPLMQISYRNEESIWIKTDKDRVTVIFSVTFKDPADIVFGKVFLQEFVDARRQTNLQNSPQVIFYPEDAPAELTGVKGIVTDKEKKKSIGYVTFVLFPRHYDAVKRQNTISLIQTFRDYLHYHIKCSKAYMHSRMRARVTAFLQVLNRAKPEVVADKRPAAAVGGGVRSFRQF
ncbi:hypothetical protein, variant [Fonticula alba]|uniref:Arp2/3 complex 34 kDa subunit n=1 Tax=Fonticula alba TaxID=691883 RepID=A0A058Z850_FONAL|nr:hypothetical protein H696_04115 [Fonticula alba]XP_009496273.1 hypothetical protein, variant [Fonticula alba]KCV69707.1 hypothetical protein H696_04115 [Fonticula alba]KCV69708.1 hypothetical protein, variant [Fonticula alba]|eukprot:XP_009496272.1 hypothetical protein H696_04115 [Fonticula alba]